MSFSSNAFFYLAEYSPCLHPLHHNAPGVAGHAEHLVNILSVVSLSCGACTHLEDGGGDLLPGGEERGQGVGAEDGAQGGGGQVLDAL